MKISFEVARDRDTEYSDKQNAEGSIGTSATQNSIYGNLGSDEYLSELRGQRGIKIYDEMRRSDPQIRMTLKAVSLPILQANWYVEPSPDDEEMGEEVADFVQRNLIDGQTKDWQYFIRHALWMLQYGFSVMEKVYDLRDRPAVLAGTRAPERVAWLRKLMPLHPTTITAFKMRDKEDGVTQMTPHGVVDIPIERLVIFSHEQEGDMWEGVSLLRSAYKPWFIKNHLEKIDAIGHERMALGVPKFEIEEIAWPSEEDDQEKLLNRLGTIASNLQANENAWVALPPGISFSFEVPQRENTDLLRSVNYWNQMIAANILAQFLSLGTTESGSRAVATEQRTPFDHQLKAAAMDIANPVSRFVIEEMVQRNYGERPGYPVLQFGNVIDTDFTALASIMKDLSESGILIADDATETWIREELGMPGKGEGTERVPDLEEYSGHSCTEEHTSQPVHSVTMEIDGTHYYAEDIENAWWRQKRPSEVFVNFSQIDYDLDQAKRTFKRRVARVARELADEFMTDLRQAVEDGDLGRISEMEFPRKQKLTSKIKGEIAPIVAYGQATVLEEVERARAGEPASEIVELRDEGIRGYAEEINLEDDEAIIAYQTAKSEQMANHIASQAEEVALAGALTAARTGAGLAVVEQAVDKSIDKSVNYASGKMVSEAFSMGRGGQIGRLTTAHGESIDGGEYSALLDNNVCGACAGHDGAFYGADTDEFHAYKDGNAEECYGADRCRCMLFLHYVDNTPPTVRDMPTDPAERIRAIMPQ